MVNRVTLATTASVLLMLPLSLVVSSAGCSESCLVLADRSIGNMETTRLTWQQSVDFGCRTESDFRILVEGECVGDGALFLYRAPGFFAEVHFFDPDSGTFIGFRQGQGDVFIPICVGGTYGPRRIDCSDPIVTNVYCGNPYGIDDHVTLP